MLPGRNRTTAWASGAIGSGWSAGVQVTFCNEPLDGVAGVVDGAMNHLIEQCTENPKHDVVLNFSAVNYLNSSNIAKLLKLRKLVAITNQRRLKVCGVKPHVWGVLLVTGLDKIFDFVEDVPSGLAALQISR